MPNDRNAGRKHKFNEKDVEEMLAMLRDGKQIEYIAKKFNTSRQVIGRYINKLPNDNYTHRIDYMLGHKPMTVIYVDFLNKQIKVQNRTNDIYDRAFGKIENPDWHAFEIFLNERVLPKNRLYLEKALKYLNIEHYVPLVIITKTKGKMEGDKFWMKIRKMK